MDLHILHYYFNKIKSSGFIWLFTSVYGPTTLSLIDESQTAFIKSRNIQDNIICAQKTLFKIRKNKNKGILFKADFEKTFDSVNWMFLIKVLKARGFEDKLISWVK
jgi:Reverse transcriptase (RNA-dependent DNA polymerase)